MYYFKINKSTSMEMEEKQLGDTEKKTTKATHSEETYDH